VYRRGLTAAGFLAVAVLSAFAAPPEGGPDGEWRHWGGTPGGVRYSPLRHIHRGNIARLTPAWAYRTGELALGLAHSSFRAAFSTTPLVVDGRLYLSTPSSRVIALDPDTGREVWTFDPQAGKPVREFSAHRGVTYWEASPARPSETCGRRILAGTVDGRLFALDAGTGRPCADFGKAGLVDLREELQGRWPQEPSFGTIKITSPPVVYRDLVITGYAQQESPGRGPYGDVRAYDVRSGREVWRFHNVPRPGELGNDTWEGESWKDRMGANVWSVMSVDTERGIVFLPIGSPTADFYGGDRKGMNLFGNSLVALEATTGRRLWHFQMVHHDLWDYDLPAQPVLFTFRADGREVPAVAQVTKMGFVYVLDRVTGQPLFPVEERPVPPSEVPGEAAWPTQPFPTKPPPLSRVTLTREDLSRVTPESADVCRALFDRSRGGTIFTPTGLKPTIFFPGLHGGGDWGGGALDPETGLFYVAANEDGAVAEMRPTSPGSPLPYRWQPRGEDLWFRDANGWPCQAPPWGSLNAVDLSRGEIAWRVPLGVVDELAARGLPKTGVQSLGGGIVTAGGLVFIGATVDRRFRAFDAKTGEELWSYRLPANAHANPMTFAGRDGRQYVVIAAGGGGFSRDLSRTVSDTLLAFALPR
jgi:membrane-bound PQQ-dependent dehydrogenase (glucose/quinate/shikimate family)